MACCVSSARFVHIDTVGFCRLPTTPAQSAVQNWTSFPLCKGPAPLSTPTPTATQPQTGPSPAPHSPPHTIPITNSLPHYEDTERIYTHTKRLYNTTPPSITHFIRIYFYRTENHRQWNAVWPPDDGRKDAQNKLGNNWLTIKSLIVASSWSRLYLLCHSLWKVRG